MVFAPGLSSLERESKTVNYYGRVWVFKLRFLWVFTDSELGSLRRDARGCGFKEWEQKFTVKATCQDITQ
ncbi:hypothetical protein MRB53_005710 [Persea americana]|uniref:Uncharacterized protein n=1 Tax=Persea americana TaxID=3435 RepID=A0ACC2MDU3_PERAE|nr:hypothetical protein MRB53_005710 [Persea americana]